MIDRMKKRWKFMRVFISVSVCFLIVSVPSSFAASQSGKTNPANLVGHGGPIKAISSDGQAILTGSFDYSAILWQQNSPTSSKLIRRYNDHDGAINAVAFVPSKNHFLSAGDDGSIYLWDRASDKVFPGNGCPGKNAGH